MTPVTKKHQQLILLEPEQATLLDELAAETRVPKQVLLREAVGDLLAKYGRASSSFHDSLETTLVAARRQVEARYKVATGKITGTGVIAQRDSRVALDLIDKIRKSWARK